MVDISQLAERIAQTMKDPSMELLRPSLDTEHENDISPTQYYGFNTSPPTAGVILGTVVVANAAGDVVLYASLDTSTEFAELLLDSSLSGQCGVDSTKPGGWGLVGVSYGFGSPGAGYQEKYVAVVPSGQVISPCAFRHDLRRLRHRPLPGLVAEGGQTLICKITVRPLGANGTIVYWPGGHVAAYGTKGCELRQEMRTSQAATAGPARIKNAFKDPKRPGTGRKSLILDAAATVASRVRGRRVRDDDDNDRPDPRPRTPR